MKKLILGIIIIFLFFLGIKNVNLDRFSLELVGHRSNLEEVTDKTLEGGSGIYSLALKNLKTGEEYFRDKDRVFDAGSLYKLWVMLVALQEIERGELLEDETLSGDVEEINRILGVTNEEAELKEGRVEFSVKSALQQMISISHNYAAVLLSQRVGTDKIQEAINHFGLKKSLIYSKDRPKTTAEDLLIFFQKVYKREDISVYVSHQIIELLLGQEINDRIPKYLPKEVRVAHKTGELDFAKHDAGIIFTPNGDYVIIVLSETDNPAAAAERIANLSKDVYEYFRRKN